MPQKNLLERMEGATEKGGAVTDDRCFVVRLAETLDVGLLSVGKQ